jgi:exonuclease III
MTFNVWFDSFGMLARANKLLRTIEEHMPDVVCLQEGTFDSIVHFHICSVSFFFHFSQ